MFNRKNSGNALFYVFMAIGLLGALTYSFTKGTKENYSVQNAARVAEELYVQSNLIKSSVLQCTMEYGKYFSEAGEVGNPADLNGDGAVNADDNNNVPFPLEPTDALNENAPAGCTKKSGAAGCISRAADNNVKNLACVGAPIGSAYIFNGENNSGAFLPPPPSGFENWTYRNNNNGVYLQIMGSANNATAAATLIRLKAKYANCQADINYGNCGETCFTVWIKRTTCN